MPKVNMDLMYVWHVKDGDNFDHLYGKVEEAAATVLRRSNNHEEPAWDDVETAAKSLEKTDRLEVNGVTAKRRRVW